MVQINFALKEVNCKLVYYGPGLSGKTTNLEVVHGKAPKNNVGELTSIATEGDRTLFFDFLPLNLGPVAGMTTKFQIYTVPGQVYYNSTRKLVLQGADGIVFVADSRRGKMDENLESLANLEENLSEYGMDINNLPLVIQYNKRDLPDVYSVEELQQKVNRFNAPYFEAVAITGEGVFPTLKKVSQMVLESLNRQQASTVVRAPKKKEGQDAKAGAKGKAPQPVAIGAPAKAGSMRVPAEGRSGAAASPPAQSAARGAPAPTRPAAANVVREKVSDSPGVKQIERKSSATAGEPVVRKKTTGVVPPVAELKKAKGPSYAVIGAIVVALLAAAGAALYFGGVLG